MSDLARYAEASRNLPLRVIIDQTGKAPTNLKLDSAFDCPLCNGSQCAYVFTYEAGRGEIFKCHGDSCPSGNEALDEIEFIALHRNHCFEVAKGMFFHEAGIRAKQLRLGDEPLIEKCIEILRDEKCASIALFQRRLNIGYIRAARVMKILEDRGIVGPHQVRPVREILKLPDLPSPAPVAGDKDNAQAHDAEESPAYLGKTEPGAMAEPKQVPHNENPTNPGKLGES